MPKKPPQIALPQSATFARDLIADLHGIDASKFGTLTARMKHLQRLEFPVGTNVGRGRKALYGITEIVLLAVAFELLQLGMTPERIVGTLRSGPNPKYTLHIMAAAWKHRGEDNGPVLMYKPTSLIDLEAMGSRVGKTVSEESIPIGNRYSVNEVFSVVGTRRVALVDAGKLMRDLALAAARHPELGLLQRPRDLRQTNEELISNVAPEFDRWSSEHGFP